MANFSGLGSTRSDAVVIVYMQRAKDAKRVYATAVNAATNTEGFRLEGVIYPTNGQQIELFKEVLDNAKVKPADVDYVESSACGEQVRPAYRVQSEKYEGFQKNHKSLCFKRNLILILNKKKNTLKKNCLSLANAPVN